MQEFSSFKAKDIFSIGIFVDFKYYTLTIAYFETGVLLSKPATHINLTA